MKRRMKFVLKREKKGKTMSTRRMIKKQKNRSMDF